MTLAGQSLNSLLHTLRKSLSDALYGDSPILHKNGVYRLNTEAGVGVDVMYFDELVNEGNRRRVIDSSSSAAFYLQAVQVYRGDLSAATDTHTIVERERLRTRFLTTLANNDYSLCLDYAQRLLEVDACREDAHRLVMRCYVRRGERAQALRQYRLCQKVLRAEYDVVPEMSTTQLFEAIRLDPDSI
jgi:DNA-binding SARP family transcriptional activator